MSIIGQATRATTTRAAAGGTFVETLVVLALTAVALVIAWRAGVFRRTSIVGPPRVADRESIGAYLILLGLALFAWIFAQGAMLPLVGGVKPAAAVPAVTVQPVEAAATSKPTASGAELSTRQLALMITIPPLFALIVVALLHGVTRDRGLRYLGLGASQIPRGLATGVVGACVMIPLVFLVTVLTEWFWRAIHYQHPAAHDLLTKMKQADEPAVAWGLIAGAVLVAPLWEEFVVRGHLQTLLTYAPSRFRWQRHRGDRGFDPIVPGELAIGPFEPAFPPVEVPTPAARCLSVGITSVLFAAIHVQPGPGSLWMLPPIFAVSVCLGYAYERTGNLWTSITMHALFNGTNTLLYFAFPH